MAGPGAVIAQGLRGVAPEENRTGMVNGFRQSLRLHHGELQMLRGNGVGDIRRLGQVPDTNQGTTTRQRGTDNLGALHLREQTLHGCLHVIEIARLRADQQCPGILIMFGL